MWWRTDRQTDSQRWPVGTDRQTDRGMMVHLIDSIPPGSPPNWHPTPPHPSVSGVPCTYKQCVTASRIGPCGLCFTASPGCGWLAARRWTEHWQLGLCPVAQVALNTEYGCGLNCVRGCHNPTTPGCIYLHIAPCQLARYDQVLTDISLQTGIICCV